jgi:hypothetical protein
MVSLVFCARQGAPLTFVCVISPPFVAVVLSPPGFGGIELSANKAAETETNSVASCFSVTELWRLLVRLPCIGASVGIAGVVKSVFAEVSTYQVQGRREGRCGRHGGRDDVISATRRITASLDCRASSPARR